MLHLLGLFSDGGVHSSQEHFEGIIKNAISYGISKIALHLIFDGRDVPPKSGLEFFKKFHLKNNYPELQYATVMGRFWAMDRDNRWERVEKAYKAMVEGISENYTNNLTKTIQDFYDKEIFDEEFPPTVVGKEGSPEITIKSEDGVIFFNFRPDRARQLTQAFVLPGFDKFERQYLKGLNFVTMTEYEKDLPAKVAFPTQELDMPLARVISEAGLKQLHLGETEKYAHVTYFFNGGNEKVYLDEDRVLVPSPHLSSYDQRPGMSAREVTNKVVQSIKEGTYDFMVVNFANADMVGHTGNFAATVEAIEILDRCVGEVVDTALSYNGVVLVTADHGNAESKYNLQTGIINKEHTNNPVPLFIVGQMYAGKSVLPGLAGTDLSQITPVGVLADVAPTILKIMGLKKPDTMTGGSLI